MTAGGLHAQSVKVVLLERFGLPRTAEITYNTKSARQAADNERIAAGKGNSLLDLTISVNSINIH